MKRPVMLMILDGFGVRDNIEGNGVKLAKTPVIDSLWQEYGHGYLAASGEAVGLPEGQMGNSEVGHLNIGAGRVVYQELTRINRDIKNGAFFENEVLKGAFVRAKEKGKAVHLMGLVSNGGVHSDMDHAIALLKMAKILDFHDVYVHCFLDGRDVLPSSALEYLDKMAEATQKETGKIASLMGRFYAMDRDNRFERVKIAWDALVHGVGKLAPNYKEAIEESYAEGITDEFVKPVLLTGEDGNPVATVQDGDSVIFFNFRTDRAREMLWAFKNPDFNGFDRGIVPKTDYTVFTCCDAAYDVPVAFPAETYVNNLGEYLGKNGKRQLRIAETEKYAHVTFFFNSQKEEPNNGEDRILIPSPKVASYDEQPAMSGEKVTEAVLEAIAADTYDNIILNFANPDMVGHTGNLDAVIEAIEFLDICVGKITDAVLKQGGAVFLTADHGNAEQMFDENGGPFTAHTSNPVPYILIDKNKPQGRKEGKLADIAPTLLEWGELEKPQEMTGNSLLFH